jgi:hypothetical protein
MDMVLLNKFGFDAFGRQDFTSVNFGEKASRIDVFDGRKRQESFDGKSLNLHSEIQRNQTRDPRGWLCARQDHQLID